MPLQQYFAFSPAICSVQGDCLAHKFDKKDIYYYSQKPSIPIHFPVSANTLQAAHSPDTIIYDNDNWHPMYISHPRIKQEVLSTFSTCSSSPHELLTDKPLRGVSHHHIQTISPFEAYHTVPQPSHWPMFYSHPQQFQFVPHLCQQQIRRSACLTCGHQHQEHFQPTVLLTPVACVHPVEVSSIDSVPSLLPCPNTLSPVTRKIVGILEKEFPPLPLPAPNLVNAVCPGTPFERSKSHDLPAYNGTGAQDGVQNDKEGSGRSREPENGHVDYSTARNETSWKGRGTGPGRNDLPFPVVSSSNHDLPSHPQPAYPRHATAEASTNMVTRSSKPSTIIYDHSSHTTHNFGSYNYQGQNVNQKYDPPAPPQDIYVKQFNGNEIHCWTPSINTNDGDHVSSSSDHTARFESPLPGRGIHKQTCPSESCDSRFNMEP